MKRVPRSRLDVIMLAHPNARVDGNICTIPTYDPETDTAGETKLELYDDPQPQKLAVGSVLQDPNTGNTFEIVDLDAMLNGTQGIKIRVGSKAQWQKPPNV